MAESPLQRIARLLGGVVLTQGRLGHQILGQMLIFGPTELEVAAASVAVAASSGTRSTVAQVALRTLAPALAVHGIVRKQEKRLVRLSRLAAEREQAAKASALAAEQKLAALEQDNAQQLRAQTESLRELNLQSERMRAQATESAEALQAAEAKLGSLAQLERAQQKAYEELSRLREQLALLPRLETENQALRARLHQLEPPGCASPLKPSNQQHDRREGAQPPAAGHGTTERRNSRPPGRNKHHKGRK